MTTDSIAFGATVINYSVRCSARSTLQIAVLPSGEVEVTAPAGSTPSLVREKVRSRARWILRQRAFFARFQPHRQVRQFLSGETHLYLGGRYRLRVEPGPSARVVLSRGFLTVQDNPEPSRERTEQLLRAWYRSHARKICEAILADLWQRHVRDASLPRLQLKSMKTRWGSLSKGGILTLNPDLVRAPRECIEYVVCHELCHLAHHDHGPAFFKLLAKRMPDWQRRKERLEIALA